MTKAIQQIMLGTVTKNEKQAAESLKRIKAAGYDGIELNGFMIKPTSFLVRMLTKAAGMPVGKGGDYDWNALVKEAGLAVTSIHEDLGTIKKRAGDCYQKRLKNLAQNTWPSPECTVLIIPIKMQCLACVRT